MKPHDHRQALNPNGPIAAVWPARPSSAPAPLALVLILIILFSAPAHADTGPLLRLEPAQRALAHPAQIEESALARVLTGLEYRERGLLGRSRGQRVFSDEEVSALTPLLRDALSRAQPKEQIRFASFSRRSGTLSQLYRTEALVFVDADQQLNLLFSGIGEFAGPDEDFFAFLALSDRDPLALQRSLLRIADGVGAWSAQEGAALWAQHDLKAASEGLPAVTTPAPTAAHAESAPAAPSELSEPRAADDSQESLVRQRLEFLRALYEDGLISEPEYEEQRREALQRLNH